LETATIRDGRYKKKKDWKLRRSAAFVPQVRDYGLAKEIAAAGYPYTRR